MYILQFQLAGLVSVCENTEGKEAGPVLFRFFSAAVSFSHFLSDLGRQHRRDLLQRQDVKLLQLDPG